MGIFTSKIRGSIGEWAVHAKLNPPHFWEGEPPLHSRIDLD